MAHPATIRAMTAADVEPAADLIRRGEWGEREAFFRYAVSAPQMSPFIAERDGAILGTGVASVHGPAGWVGTIFVDPSERGTGLGRALTEATTAVIAAAGCATQILVATDLGRPVYERLGFETRTFYQVFEREGVAPDEAVDAAIRPFAAGDVEDAAALDREATGEDRRPLLAAMAATEGGIVLRGPDGRVAGFVLRTPWGGGATVARDPAAAGRLLSARLRRAGPDRLVRVGTPLENEAGIAALESDGWRHTYRARRMELGPRPAWRPEWLWGQFNMAVG
jgi:GNAT superfamily N-acetyltransferase